MGELKIWTGTCAELVSNVGQLILCMQTRHCSFRWDSVMVCNVVM